MYNGSFDLSNESKPIRDIAYDRLKHAIITGELPAGSRIVETTYAEQLHISRTPLREALRKLERDGLVEYVLRRGVVVRAFTINDIEEIFTIRNAMMMLILPSVIKNVTDKDIAELRVLLSEMDVAQAEADCDALATFNRAFHSKIEHLSDKTRILRVIDDQEEYITRFAAHYHRQHCAPFERPPGASPDGGSVGEARPAWHDEADGAPSGRKQADLPGGRLQP